MFEVIRRMDKIEVAKCDCGGLISWDEDDFYGSCKKCNQVYQRGREVE